MSPFKPMLASEADLSKLRFPVLLSPKYDGIRCVVHPELGAVSRNLKPIPNAHVRRLLDEHARGLDGEIVVGDPTARDCFQRTTSAVMSRDGEPEFTFWAFDAPWECGSFRVRLRDVAAKVAMSAEEWLRAAPHAVVPDIESLSTYEAERVADGWEGVMLRDPLGDYKQGRSTAREGGLLKLKRFKDAEAVIVGVEELLRNGNAATVDALGHTQRSSHKANLTPAGIMGALRVRHDLGEFTVGTGFTQEQRADFWTARADLVGRVIKFRYQEVGTKDLPRFPTFVGFRAPGDL